MKINDLLGEGWRNRDSYQRDYDSSRTGFGRPPREDDEYVNGDEDEVRSYNQYMAKHADVPHDVHINGKKWKSFGSHSHASNVAKKIKGATVHKSITETASAGATSAANIATVVNPDYANNANTKPVKSVNALDQDEVSVFGAPMETMKNASGKKAAIIKRR
jgi:hypothetical protein